MNITKAEHVESLESLALGAVLAKLDVVNMTRFVQFESSYHALCGDFLLDSFAAALGVGVWGYPGISHGGLVARYYCTVGNG